MKCNKGFFHPIDGALTHVYDPISAFIPDQSLSLRQMMMQFAYIGTERLEEIVNRGYYGDEDDDDIIGVDVGALDFAEVHDRIIDLQSGNSPAGRVVHRPVINESDNDSVTEFEDDVENVDKS